MAVLDDPAAIIARALRDKASFSTKVLDAFCGILGIVAADIALDLSSLGGVYVIGGMVSRFANFLAASSLRRRFEDHSAYSQYLQRIPTVNTYSEYPPFW